MIYKFQVWSVLGVGGSVICVQNVTHSFSVMCNVLN